MLEGLVVDSNWIAVTVSYLIMTWVFPHQCLFLASLPLFHATDGCQLPKMNLKHSFPSMSRSLSFSSVDQYPDFRFPKALFSQSKVRLHFFLEKAHHTIYENSPLNHNQLFKLSVLLNMKFMIHMLPIHLDSLLVVSFIITIFNIRYYRIFSAKGRRKFQHGPKAIPWVKSYLNHETWYGKGWNKTAINI